jgi:Thiamine pyrophosphate enzyme, C-terminal TPP binding domain
MLPKPVYGGAIVASGPGRGVGLTLDTPPAHEPGPRRWIVLGVSTTVNALAWGARATFALFFVAILTEFSFLVSKSLCRKGRIVLPPALHSAHLRFPNQRGYFGSPDFVALARAFGCDGVGITAAKELRPSLGQALAARVPVVIDYPVDYRENDRLAD